MNELGERGDSWLGSAADRASESSGLQMAFLLTHTKQAAAAVSVVTYLHRFSFDVGAASNTEVVAHYLRGRAGTDDEPIGEH